MKTLQETMRDSFIDNISLLIDRLIVLAGNEVSKDIIFIAAEKGVERIVEEWKSFCVLSRRSAILALDQAISELAVRMTDKKDCYQRLNFRTAMIIGTRTGVPLTSLQAYKKLTN